jgi:hypothetical protein
MMAHCQFGDSFPLDCIRDIIKMLRSGDLDDNKWKLVKEISCVLGTAANMMDDDDDSPEVFGAVENEVADKLESLLPADDALMSSVSWLAIIKIVLPILISLLKENEDA